MRSLSATLKFLSQGLVFSLQLLYLHLKHCYLFMSFISNELKILYSVIIPNSVSMMDDFPTMQATPQMLCHYETMLKNTSSTVSHWVKKVIGMKGNQRVTLFGYATPTLPPMVIDPISDFWFVCTRCATLSHWWFKPNWYPSFLPTVKAGKPLIPMPPCFTDIFAFRNITKLFIINCCFHTNIIA